MIKRIPPPKDLCVVQEKGQMYTWMVKKELPYIGICLIKMP